MTILDLLEPMIHVSLGQHTLNQFNFSYENSTFSAGQTLTLSRLLDFLKEIIESDLFKENAIEEIKDYCKDLEDYLKS